MNCFSRTTCCAFILIAVLALSLLSVGVYAQPYTNYQCPLATPAWNGPFEVTFNYGANCACIASAKYCVRVVNGVTEFLIGGLAFDPNCVGHAEPALVIAARSAIWQNAADDNVDGNLNYPPCGQGYTSTNVKTISGWCYTQFEEPYTVVINGTVEQRTRTVRMTCAEIVCIKECAVCYDGDDPCNPGKKNLIVSCQTQYMPTQECPNDCSHFLDCSGTP